MPTEDTRLETFLELLDEVYLAGRNHQNIGKVPSRKFWSDLEQRVRAILADKGSCEFCPADGGPCSVCGPVLQPTAQPHDRPKDLKCPNCGITILIIYRNSSDVDLELLSKVKLCGCISSDGHLCSREFGHKGDHCTRYPNGMLMAQWQDPQPDETDIAAAVESVKAKDLEWVCNVSNIRTHYSADGRYRIEPNDQTCLSHDDFICYCNGHVIADGPTIEDAKKACQTHSEMPF